MCILLIFKIELFAKIMFYVLIISVYLSHKKPKYIRLEEMIWDLFSGNMSWRALIDDTLDVIVVGCNRYVILSVNYHNVIIRCKSPVCLVCTDPCVV